MAFGISERLRNLFRITQYGSLKDNIRFLKYKLGKNKCLTIRKKGNKKWAYISYIPEALLRSDPSFLNMHQNRREMKVIAECFLENGYNIDVQFYETTQIPKRKYDIVFGLEPAFTECAKKNPEATKIYYGTGAYFKYANSEVVNRTNEFNEKHNMNVVPRRLAPEDECIEICDRILQIGTVNTIDTYPPHFKPKITLINQSSNFLIDSPKLDNKYNRRKFLWLGSGGSILKGADLVIESFLQHPELEIDLIGPIEPEVIDAYSSSLETAGNIRLHGFVDVNSRHFFEIVSGTTFIIFPSVTEGVPGSVVVAQKLGLIPILSKVASPKEISELGYMLDDISTVSIEKALAWSQNLASSDVSGLQSKNKQFSKRFSLDNFRNEFNYFLKSL